MSKSVNKNNVIENPCYHCYTGAAGECFMACCKYDNYSWSKDIDCGYIELSEEDMKTLHK